MNESTSTSDGLGRNAAWPAHIGWPGWRDIVWRTWTESFEDNIELIAAKVAFYGFLSIVPVLTVLVLGYGLFSQGFQRTVRPRVEA